MKHKIVVLFVLALAVAAPVYANYALAPHSQLEVACPNTYAVRLRNVSGQPAQRGVVYCEAATPTPAVTTLPPLLSPLSTPAPVPALPTMPTQG